jgi:CheY-like chemotaxis protein
MTLTSISSVQVGPEATKPTDPRPRRIRALIADSSPTCCEVIGALLKIEDCIEIVGRVSDGQETIEAVTVLQPDLLLIDVGMPHIDAISVAAIVSLRSPTLIIIFISDRNNSPRLRAQIRISGTQFFVYKPKFTEEFARLLPGIDSASRAGRAK